MIHTRMALRLCMRSRLLFISSLEWLLSGPHEQELSLAKYIPASSSHVKRMTRLLLAPLPFALCRAFQSHSGTWVKCRRYLCGSPVIIPLHPSLIRSSDFSCVWLYRTTCVAVGAGRGGELVQLRGDTRVDPLLGQLVLSDPTCSSVPHVLSR